MGRARQLGFRAARLSGLPVLLRETIQRRRPTIVLYHDPDPARFERHISVLRQRYTIIGLRSLIEALRGGTIDVLPPKSLVVTLDDGHRGNRALLPILERLGVPVSIFLCASIVGSDRRFWFKHVDDPAPLKRLANAERLRQLELAGVADSGAAAEALSDAEIGEMSPHVDFQSHGLTHPILPRCDDDEARAEVVESRRELAERYGFDVYAFSYPNGDYGERELRLVREAGYLCAVTVEPGFIHAGTDSYRLKRICIDDNDGVDELLVKSSGLWGLIGRVGDGVVGLTRIWR